MGGLFSSKAAKEAKFKRDVTDLVSRCLGDKRKEEWANEDLYTDLGSVETELRRAGMESTSLLLGIDLTASNKKQGEKSFHGHSLHALDSPHGKNPYEMVIGIIGKALAPFDDDNKIPTFVFGDITTRAHSVRQIGAPGGCPGVEGPGGVLDVYRREVASASLSGPTSFAPLIDSAVNIVRNRGNRHHILVIIADGIVPEVENCLADTTEAIARASSWPLSIIMVGVGDGPWDEMVHFDDGLPDRKFDNFQFVPFDRFHELFHQIGGADEHKVLEAAFAVCAVQEVPAQYTAMNRLGLLRPRATDESAVETTGQIRRLEERASTIETPPVKRLRNYAA